MRIIRKVSDDPHIFLFFFRAEAVYIKNTDGSYKISLLTAYE